MNVLGQVNIGTNIEHADIVDASQTNIQDNSQATQETRSQAPQTATNKSMQSTPIILNPRITKIDFYRVVNAMHECGFFLNNDGTPTKKKEVFAAFSTLLQSDFSDFQKNLSEASKVNNDSTATTNIFARLQSAAEQYANK